MRKFYSFLAGFAVSVVLIAFGSYYFIAGFHFGKSAPSKLELPSGKGFSSKGGFVDATTAANTVFLEGDIDLAPLLQKELTKDKATSLHLVLKAWDQGENLGAAHVENVRGVTFPQHFAFSVPKPRLGSLTDGSDLFNLVAVLCLGENSEERCTSHTLPRLQGRIRFHIKEGVTKLSVGTIFFNSHFRTLDLEECVKSGTKISGTIMPSPSFAAQLKGAKQFAIVAVPRNLAILPPLIQGPEARSPTLAELNQMLATSIAAQNITLSGGNGASFSLTLPKQIIDQPLSFYALPCNAGEAPLACTARVFPLRGPRTRG